MAKINILLDIESITNKPLQFAPMLLELLCEKIKQNTANCFNNEKKNRRDIEMANHLSLRFTRL